MKGGENGKDRKVLYEQVKFFRIESKYSQTKLQLCGVAGILKKFQTILWEKHFEVQVDANNSIEIINTPCLPNAPMTREVESIDLFFELVQNAGKKFNMIDVLLSKPKGEEEKDSEKDNFYEEEEWIKPHPGLILKELNTRKVGKLSRNKENNIYITMKQE
ncbi:hypothetical protein O181_019588 [Austropuccinia psidii MF-1]|uniref:Reverse transcriptase RNase H-like domain-containing protein n=1 Tax=Austropuccinia psidii MF-1 TaxID=1389203 RepID=A0A9Q3GTR0_9BASI|nr:hypothetical protein [Austropuccinia psidii MF-1]